MDKILLRWTVGALDSLAAFYWGRGTYTDLQCAYSGSHRHCDAQFNMALDIAERIHAFDYSQEFPDG